MSRLLDWYRRFMAKRDVPLKRHWRVRFERDPMHFAILSRLDPPYIIHAVELRGGVVEHRVDNVWRNRIMRAYRYREAA